MLGCAYRKSLKVYYFCFNKTTAFCLTSRACVLRINCCVCALGSILTITLSLTTMGPFCAQGGHSFWVPGVSLVVRPEPLSLGPPLFVSRGERGQDEGLVGSRCPTGTFLPTTCISNAVSHAGGPKTLFKIVKFLPLR